MSTSETFLPNCQKQGELIMKQLSVEDLKSIRGGMDDGEYPPPPPPDAMTK